MALTAANVRVAVTGVVSVGATSATAPTGTGTSAPTGFTDLGYVGEDGVTESPSKTTNPVKAWQTGATVRRVVTEGEYQISFTLIETSKATVELYYGATATTGVSEGSIAVIPTNTGGQKSFCIDVVDGSEKKRIYVATGEVTEVGDIVYRNGEAIGYPITITAYPTATGESATVFSTALKS